MIKEKKRKKRNVVSTKITENETYEPSDEEIKIQDDYKEKLVLAKDWQDKIYEKLIRYYFLYRGLQEEEEYPWRNNICLPIAFSTIETLTPRVLLNQPKITLKGLNEEAKQYVEQSKAILDYNYFNKDFQLELIDWFKRNFIYGISILKVMFRKQEKLTPIKKSISKFKRFFRLKGKSKINQFVDIKAIEPYHFKIDDPQSNYIKNANWVINDVYLTEKEVKDNREGIYKNLKFVQAKEVKDDFASAKWEVNQLSNKKRGRILKEGITSIGSSQSFKRQKLVKISELYMKRTKEFPLGRLRVFANDEILLRDDINPYWYIDGEFPFVEIKDQPVPGEFYAVGEIESIESLIYEKNHIRNRRLDSSEQSADQMWWVNPESEMDENELVIRPGGIINGVQGEDFGLLEKSEPYLTMSGEENLVENDIQSTIGFGDVSKGKGEKYETATGLMALINEANQRFAAKIKIIGEMGIARLSKMILQMEQFESSGDRIGRITGKDEEFIGVKASEIHSDYNFKVSIDPNPLINKTLNVETLNKVLQTLSAQPEGKGFSIVQKAIIKQLDVLSDEEVDKAMGEKNELAGTLPRKLQPRKVGGGSSAKANAEVISGQKTAAQAQPTRPQVVAPGVNSIPKKINRK